MADYAFRGAYRTLTANDPIKQVSKLPWINDLFYRNTRKVEVRQVSDSSCSVVYRHGPHVRLTRSGCLISMGFCVRTLELFGTRT